MDSIDLPSIYAVLANSETFTGLKIKVRSIYNSHPEEKCFRIETHPRSSDYKVRFTTLTSKRSAATEYEAFKVLQQNNIAWTPQIYEYRPADPAYLITDYKKGESLDKSRAWVRSAQIIVTGLNAILADIHKLEGDYFGHLGGTKYNSWQAFLDVRFWKHARNVFDAGIINSADLDKIHLLYEESKEMFDKVRPTLLHGDVKAANIIYDSELKVVSLVDFELARYGDLDFEWVRVYYLSKRWPEYRKLISEPLLNMVNFRHSAKNETTTTILIYSLYHIFSVIAFEYKKEFTIPDYRLKDLHDILEILRERYK